MDDHKHTNRVTDAPSAIERARIALDDEMDLMLDNVRGAAYILGNLADSCSSGEERLALNMLADNLRANVERVQAAQNTVLDLEKAEV